MTTCEGYLPFFSKKFTVVELPVQDLGLLSNPERSGQVYLGALS